MQAWSLPIRDDECTAFARYDLGLNSSVWGQCLVYDVDEGGYGWVAVQSDAGYAVTRGDRNNARIYEFEVYGN
ncbi:hypothetical protein D3C85_1525350 [compost metagenome]